MTSSPASIVVSRYQYEATGAAFFTSRLELGLSHIQSFPRRLLQDIDARRPNPGVQNFKELPHKALGLESLALHRTSGGLQGGNPFPIRRRPQVRKLGLPEPRLRVRPDDPHNPDPPGIGFRSGILQHLSLQPRRNIPPGMTHR